MHEGLRELRIGDKAREGDLMCVEALESLELESGLKKEIRHA